MLPTIASTVCIVTLIATVTARSIESSVWPVGAAWVCAIEPNLLSITSLNATAMSFA